MTNMLMAGDVVVVVKGSAARSVRQSTFARVITVSELGPDYSHQVKVVLDHGGARRIGWVARHRNRLTEGFINLNDGNPNHRIVIRPYA